MAYIDTPQTEADVTYMSNGHNLENFSVENSILSPLKRKDNLVSQLRNGRGVNLKTPRARVPFSDRRNLPTVPARGEFTPLLQSVAKKNLERNGRLSGGPETPAFLKQSYRGGNTPALPGAEVSQMYGSDFGSSVLQDGDGTPMPQVASSSAQSTPLAVLPKRDATGVLQDPGNVMTLREQESIIDKIEKENFGLKLKIHFLEESLRKSGPGFNEAALKENTDLKVDRVTMQKELVRTKKMLGQAERDVDAFRRHLEEVQEKAKRKHADESLRQELEDLKKDVNTKDAKIEDLRHRLERAESNGDEIDKLKADIEDFEADLREKDRLLDERCDEVERLKERVSKDSEELDEVYAELEVCKKRVDELEEGQGDSEQQAINLQEAKDELKEALQEKRKAQEDLKELQDEMANKSINTKGLSRQLEEKANKLQDDLTILRERYSDLDQRFGEKSREAKSLQERLQDAEQDSDVRHQRLSDQLELLRNDRDAMVKKCESLTTQAQQAVKDMQITSEEKELLHSRHDALAAESQVLQKELSRAQVNLNELEANLEDEKQHAQDNDRQLRSEAKHGIDHISEELNSLHRKLTDKESEHAAGQDHWESQKRSIESQKQKAEERAAGLQRTIERLQEAEGTLSSREIKLHEALESEKQRHKDEEDVLEHRIEELQDEINEKRQTLEGLRSDLSQTNEDLRISQRERLAYEEKVQALEDEVEVLQSGLDDEAGKVRQEVNAIEQEAEILRLKLEEAKEQLALAENDQRDKVQSDSMLSLTQDHKAAEEQLRQIKTERQTLRDSLVKTKFELQKLQVSSADITAERDEIRSQFEQIQNQVEDTFKLDQEKLDLRTSKLRLDSELGRVREERNALLEKNAAVERDLSRAISEEGRLSNRIAEMQRDLSSASNSRDRESNNAKQKILRLEHRIEELGSQPQEVDDHGDAAAELSIIRKDLSAARRKEVEHLGKEAAQKELIRDLKQKVTRLERQIYDSEIARMAIDSPKSSTAGSIRKSELIETQRQLKNAHQQLKDARAKSREESKTLNAMLALSERQAQANVDKLEKQIEQIEIELSATRHEKDLLETKNNSSLQTINRLRTRIVSLESDVHAHRQASTADNTMAEERKDLHDMLKDAKLTVEDLQNQIDSQEQQLASATSREKDLRAQLKRIRVERSTQNQKSSALGAELDSLQNRYERSISKFSQQQRTWEEERKAINSRVRFTNMSVSSLHTGENQIVDLKAKYDIELNGMTKLLQWMWIKLWREQTYRTALIFQKDCMGKQIRNYEICNRIKLDLLKKSVERHQLEPSIRTQLGMTLKPKESNSENKRPSLKTVAFAFIACSRMSYLRDSWISKQTLRKGISREIEEKYDPDRMAARERQIKENEKRGKGKRMSSGR